MKLCWEKTCGRVSYGWDDSRKTGPVKNSVSFVVFVRGYFVGFSY